MAESPTPCGWSADAACCPGKDQLPAGVWEASVATATEVLWSLTGRQFGACRRTVRPCHVPCATSCGSCAGNHGPQWAPALIGGEFYNLTCQRGDDCQCGSELSTITLPGPVHKVTAVVVDGVELDPLAYVVYSRRQLVRVDGKSWPTCQHLDRDLAEPGTWAVIYERGKPLSQAGRRAVGLLACELARLCAGDKCRLPSRVTSVVRDGVTWSFDAEGFYTGGLTGIPEVDMWIKAVNPHKVMRRASSWSPDGPKAPRQRTGPPDAWGGR
ncbi:hypothetical protein RCO28_37935 [Streptomyces sp. LHD-70]|uniref:hypothetical protein n=1 Tax=Streptomyces sp. LHD-70 TaxID=3072140 RepID=UPI00280DBBF8|nr:hypothetical protein [Streptomyces sp. LHD-70]MDQ8708199.1 hypothetical protein [Streptomyces sp. LHD-70]